MVGKAEDQPGLFAEEGLFEFENPDRLVLPPLPPCRQPDQESLKVFRGVPLGCLDVVRTAANLHIHVPLGASKEHVPGDLGFHGAYLDSLCGAAVAIDSLGKNGGLAFGKIDFG